jgi:hypothetical protein
LRVHEQLLTVDPGGAAAWLDLLAPHGEFRLEEAVQDGRAVYAAARSLLSACAVTRRGAGSRRRAGSGALDDRFEAALTRADRLLYAVKFAGRNRIHAALA